MFLYEAISSSCSGCIQSIISKHAGTALLAVDARSAVPAYVHAN